MKSCFTKILALVAIVAGTTAQKIVLTNDDSWAVAQIRDEYNQLKAAGYQVNSICVADFLWCSLLEYF